MVKNIFISQSGPLHGTIPAAFTGNGTKIIDNKQNSTIGKNIFFI
jgi:hypothetical protein